MEIAQELLDSKHYSEALIYLLDAKNCMQEEPGHRNPSSKLADTMTLYEVSKELNEMVVCNLPKSKLNA